MNSIIIVKAKNVKIHTASQNSTIICQDCIPKISTKMSTVDVLYKKVSEFTIDSFISIYDIQIEDNCIILFKIVNSDLKDFYTTTIIHTINTWIEVQDWNPNKNCECGGGFHACSKISLCKRFNNNGRFLKLKVPLKLEDGSDNVLVHPNPDFPEKVRFKRCFVIEEVIE
jgi:hypothetical protein